jgi:hypothetical protein
LQRDILRKEAQIEKAYVAEIRKEKAIAKKADIEACKAKAATNKASKLASRALKASTRPNKGKRKLVESNIEVGSPSVAKRVALATSRGRAIITPARFIQTL